MIGRPVIVVWVGLLLVACSIPSTATRSSIPTTSIGGPTTTTPATLDLPSTTRRQQATISVMISDIDGAVDNQVVGVLYRGPLAINPDENVVGGFAVTVDADPFSTTQQVFKPQPDLADWSNFRGPFPWVTEEPQRVEPGTYTLLLWLARRLGAYSRWVPGDERDLAACASIFDVGQDVVTVEIDGDSIVPLEGAFSPCATQWPPFPT